MRRNYLTIILFTFSMVACKNSGLVKVNCPPIAFYYKQPEKFFPDAIKTSALTINHALNIANKVIDSFKLVSSQKAEAISERLNQFAALNRELVKTSFLSSNAQPCNYEAKKKLDELIAKINDQNFQYQSFAQKITATQNLDIKRSLLDTLYNIPPISNAGPDQIIQLPNTR